MPANLVHEPLRSRAGPGLTLVELLIGISILGTLGLVTVGLFKAGISTYHYSMSQLISLTHSRQALAGSGDRLGLLAGVQDARFVLELSPESLVVSPPDGPSIRYYVSDSNLYQSQTDLAVKQAEGIQEMQVKYYNFDETGRLIESTSAVSAAMVTTYLKLSGCERQDCVHFSGAALRNHS